MYKTFPRDFSQRNTKFGLFIFSGLLILSTAFFVFAGDPSSTKNIFQDSDQDGLSNDEEKLYGTNPNLKDSDGDGYGDGVEVESGYDPRKPAPGDKIVKETSSDTSPSNPSSATQDEKNLTEKVSSEITVMLKNAGQGGDEVSMEDVDTMVQKILEENTNEEEVILPEINIEEIKIKKGPSKSLSDEKRKKQEHDDALEYLTVIAYIIANNSPQSFQTEDDLNNILTNLTENSIAALSSRAMEPLNQLSVHAEKIMVELKDIEVPEKMLNTHIKALKMAKYAIQLKEELIKSQNDPLRQIAALAKMQGFLANVMEFTSEVNKKLSDYGIEEIPLNTL